MAFSTPRKVIPHVHYVDPFPSLTVSGPGSLYVDETKLDLSNFLLFANNYIFFLFSQIAGHVPLIWNLSWNLLYLTS